MWMVLVIWTMIPKAWADFGNKFVANQRLSTPLDASTNKLSYRFTCQEEMDAIAAAVFCSEGVNPPAYILSLQKDANGLPSGQQISSSHFIPLAQTWSTVPLPTIGLTKGKVYHLVLEQDVLRGGGHPVGVIGPRNFAAFLTTDVLNHIHPNDDSPDPAANTLLFNGKKWKELNQEPLYALYGAGNHLQGNPYDDPGVRPIYGNGADKSTQVWQGQSLHFHCGVAATAFAVRIRKQGHPTTPLNYSILKHFFQIHKTMPIYSAVALTPSQAPSDFQWVTIGFGDLSKSNFSPECWFLVFQTDSGRPSNNGQDCEDCYLISDVGNSGGLAAAADMTFDNGPHLTREVFSIDGGNPLHWMDAFERDLNVRAIGPACPPPLERDFKPLPTPEPLDSSLIRDAP